MDSQTAGGLINQILWDIDQVHDLGDDTMLTRCADSINQQRHFRSPAGDYAQAIATVLRDGRLAAPTRTISRFHSEPALLTWLGRLAPLLSGREPVRRAERAVNV